MANEDKITSSCPSRGHVAKIKLASSSNRLVIQGAGGVKQNPRVGAGRTSESRSPSPSSRVIRTYYESRYGSASVSATPSIHAYTKDLTCRRRLSSPVFAHPPVSARAPVDNAIEASFEAIEAICRQRCRGLRTEIQYQNKNKAGGMVRRLTCREGATCSKCTVS